VKLLQSKLESIASLLFDLKVKMTAHIESEEK